MNECSLIGKDLRSRGKTAEMSMRNRGGARSFMRLRGTGPVGMTALLPDAGRLSRACHVTWNMMEGVTFPYNNKPLLAR